MKKLKVHKQVYLDYEEQFKRWLALMGMSPAAQYNMPLRVRELFHHCEQKGIVEVDQITPQVLRDYFTWLRVRKNDRRGGGLSKGTINKQLQAIKKFSEYLWQAHRIQLPVTLKRLVEDDRGKIDILTEKEIATLYDLAASHSSLGPRDLVILDMFYACGLRRNEGYRLDLEDIDLEGRRIHVRYGKNYTQRYVPFTKRVAGRLRHYTEQCRLELIKKADEKAFFISQHGRRMDGQSMLLRIKKLHKNCPLLSIHKKHIGLHTLRHSIATHLLHKGIPVAQIAIFLGHKSIESTQIYTHLIHEL
jgi:integrase/recombinase XerD